MKNFLLAVVSLVLVSCGSNNDCPSGFNTTNPNCPNYSPYQNQYPNYQQQQPCQAGTPNCVNGYYQTPNNQYPNGQYPNYQQPCQPGTPNCVNGYYQYPNNQYPYNQYPNNQYPYNQYPTQPRY